MRALLFVVALVTACASNRPKPDESTYCADSRGKYCMTEKVCSFDRTRECFVCQCSSGQNPVMRPPDSPVPNSDGSIRTE